MSKPRRIGAAVAGVRARAMPRTLLAAVQAAWPDAVGRRIAAESQPTAERDGRVTIACHTATWAEELDLLHDELLARLNATLADSVPPDTTADSPAVRGLRFVVG